MTRTSTSIANLTITAELVFQAAGEGANGRLQVWKVTLAASGGTVTLHDLDLTSIIQSDETPIGVTGFYNSATDAASYAGVIPSTKLLYAQKADGNNATLASGASCSFTLMTIKKVNSQA